MSATTYLPAALSRLRVRRKLVMLRDFRRPSSERMDITLSSFMQCGPVRHRVTVKTQQASDQIERLVRVRRTGFALPEALKELMSLTIHDVYESLIHNEQRNQKIVSDALFCVGKGFYPLVLTERREHLDLLTKLLEPVIPNLVVLTGGMNQKMRKEAEVRLQQKGPRLVLATGRYLGEGFDDERLDTLLLTMPISWKGTLAQYAGRLHRIREGKRVVTIYDYADLQVPMLGECFSADCVDTNNLDTR